METSERKDCANTRCKCPCHKMMGILLILIGIVFLLGDYGVVTERFVAIAWPSLLILIGLKKAFSRGMCKCCSKSGK